MWRKEARVFSGGSCTSTTCIYPTTLTRQPHPPTLMLAKLAIHSPQQSLVVLINPQQISPIFNYPGLSFVAEGSKDLFRAVERRRAIERW